MTAHLSTIASLFVFLGSVGGLLTVFAWLMCRHAPLRDADTGPLDHWDGRGWRPCHLHNDGCHTVGTVIRRERAELGGQQVLVCPGHDATGQRKGWWVA